MLNLYCKKSTYKRTLWKTMECETHTHTVYMYSEVPYLGDQGWGRGVSLYSEVPCPGGRWPGPGTLYGEVQCIMDNGDMGIPPTPWTGRHD